MPKGRSLMSKKSTESANVFTMSLTTLTARCDEVRGLLERVHELLPGLIHMPSEDRRTSDGKYRDGESAALSAVATFAKSQPQYFTVLADKDGGEDPTRFEAELLGEHLARRDLLATLQPMVEELSTLLSDSEMHLGEQTRKPLLEAYGIAKSLAQHDPTVRTAISAPLDYYARTARRAAETRLARREKAPSDGENGAK
jgi:hypothetical protein